MKSAIKKYLNRNEDRRIDWVKKQLSSIESGKKILDAGAGEMRYRPFCQHLNYVSQDFCQYDGTGNNQGLQTATWDTSKIDLVSDIKNIPAESSTFDAVLCTEVIEHVSEPILAIAEFSRLLKSNGQLILTAPFASLTHFAPFHFYSGFNVYFYQEIFKKYDLEILEITPNGNYLEFLEQEQIRVLITFLKNKKFASAFFALLGFVSYKILSLFKSSKVFKDPNLLCFGYQIVARKK